MVSIEKRRERERDSGAHIPREKQSSLWWTSNGDHDLAGCVSLRGGVVSCVHGEEVWLTGGVGPVA